MVAWYRPSILVILFINAGQIAAQPAGYNFGKRITLNSSEISGTTALADFPILISLTDNDLRTISNGGAVENSNGFDIVFTLDDCAAILDHEIEHYDATTGEFIAWVRIPSLSPTVDMDIGMFYGNSSVSTDPSTNSTWNSGFEGVYHLHDDFLDATANGNNGTNNGSTDTGGLFGDGQEFDGANDYIQTPVDLQTEDDFTLSAWINADATTQQHIIWQGNVSQNGWGASGGGNQQEMHLSLGSCCLATEVSDLASAYLGNDEDETDSEVLTAQDSYTDTGNWHYLTATFSDINTTPLAELFIDGVSVDIDDGVADASTARNNWTSDLRLGRPGAATRLFDGLMDEVRISTVIRSDDWIQTEYNNQNDPSSFYTVSAQFTAAAACSVLPVEILFFKAEVQQKNVKLNWATASERDFDFFTLMRSADAQEFYDIATINGAGYSDIRIDYQYLDQNPLQGVSYYWLKATDFDGSIEHFNIERVVFNSRFVDITPNPLVAGQFLHANVSIGDDETASIKLYTVLGRKLFNQSLIKGYHQIDLPPLSPGIYLLTVQYPGETRYQKLVIP